LRIYVYINRLDTGELVEKHGLALHDWLARQGSEVAEAKHCRAIGDDSHHVTFVRVFVGLLSIFEDLQAWGGHSWGISQ